MQHAEEMKHEFVRDKKGETKIFGYKEILRLRNFYLIEDWCNTIWEVSELNQVLQDGNIDLKRADEAVTAVVEMPEEWCAIPFGYATTDCRHFWFLRVSMYTHTHTEQVEEYGGGGQSKFICVVLCYVFVYVLLCGLLYFLWKLENNWFQFTL